LARPPTGAAGDAAAGLGILFAEPVMAVLCSSACLAPRRFAVILLAKSVSVISQGLEPDELSARTSCW
jgi:hypothetical protein